MATELAQAVPVADWDVPVSTGPDLALLEDQKVPWQQFVDAAEQRLASRQIAGAEELRKRIDVRLRLDIAAREERLDFGSEQQQRPRGRPVERLDTQAIANEQQPTPRRVPEGEREHAAQVADAVVTPLLVRVDDCFRIAARFVLVAACFQVASNLGVVVNLAVVRDPN